jgi:hypothetical protein
VPSWNNNLLAPKPRKKRVLRRKWARHPCLMPVILAIQEAEIRRIKV